jgi:organic hydroperoxide reductase OsmC/OhrA
MRIVALVKNSRDQHHVTVQTNDNSRTLSIPPGASGFGSSANGGELLFLALATCYCNDIYREADKRGMAVERVEVQVEGDFGDVGEPGRDIVYHATVTANASEQDIRALMLETNRVAEIQNTLRLGVPVALGETRAIRSQT